MEIDVMYTFRGSEEVADTKIQQKTLQDKMLWQSSHL